VRVAIVSECFLPTVNGVTNSVLRVIEHLRRDGHQVLVVAPGPAKDDPDEYLGVPVVRVPALDLPVVNSMPVGLPTRRVLTALRRFAPDVVHLAAPFVVGARGWPPRAGSASQRSRCTRPTWPVSPPPTASA